MTRGVEVLPEAEHELERAFRWYERQRRGLGFQFLLAFDAATEQIAQLPKGHAVVAHKTRKAILKRFPYVVLYALEDDRILVTSVFHGRRDPRYWADRVREGALATILSPERSASGIA